MDHTSARAANSWICQAHRAAIVVVLLPAIATLLLGCQDGRVMKLDEVTPQARVTIAKIAGKDVISEIREVKRGERLQYLVQIERGGKQEDYTVDDAGVMRD